MTTMFTRFRHLYGKWCSWETQVHREDGTSFTRTEYGLILPDDTAASLGCLTVMDIEPGDITIDYDVDPATITILDDVPPAFCGGWASWVHPNDRTETHPGGQQ